MNYAPPEIVLVSGGAILFERCKHAISFYKAEIFEKQKGLKKSIAIFLLTCYTNSI